MILPKVFMANPANIFLEASETYQPKRSFLKHFLPLLPRALGYRQPIRVLAG